MKKFKIYLTFEGLDKPIEHEAEDKTREHALDSILRGVEWFEVSKGKYKNVKRITDIEVVEVSK